MILNQKELELVKHSLEYYVANKSWFLPNMLCRDEIDMSYDIIKKLSAKETNKPTFKSDLLKPCKKCGLLPNVEYKDRSFTISCPQCNSLSSINSLEFYRIESAIIDWNTYHAKEN